MKINYQRLTPMLIPQKRFKATIRIVLISIYSTVFFGLAQAQDIPAGADSSPETVSKQAPQIQITADGFFEDWADVPDFATESTMDSPGIGSRVTDFQSLSILDDNENIYLLLDVTNELLVQSTDLSDPMDGQVNYGSDMRLFIDGDNNPNTGLRTAGIGVDVQIQFGIRNVEFYQTNGSSFDSTLTALGCVVYPTHTSSQFEIVLSKDNDEFDWLTADTIQFFLLDDLTNDRFPDAGSFTYELNNEELVSAEPIIFDKATETEFRLLVHNVENTSPAFNPAPYVRLLQATQPDIVCWQEVRTGDWSDNDVLNFFNSNYPSPTGNNWTLTRQSDTITLSPWPVLDSGSLSSNQVTVIDLPDEFGESNLVIFNVHTPCCNNDSGRDFEHDQVSAAWRDILNGNGIVDADPENDIVMMVGDFNMVGIRRQFTTLRDGDIINSGSFGNDFSPGRERGSLVAVETRHNYSNQTYTWYNPSESFAPGRLDWVFYSDDFATLRKSFAILANDLPAEILTQTGLQGNETPDDHLPIVLDFSINDELMIETDDLLIVK